MPAGALAERSPWRRIIRLDSSEEHPVPVGWAKRNVPITFRPEVRRGNGEAPLPTLRDGSRKLRMRGRVHSPYEMTR
jgi:hypothetical protein